MSEFANCVCWSRVEGSGGIWRFRPCLMVVRGWILLTIWHFWWIAFLLKKKIKYIFYNFIVFNYDVMVIVVTLILFRGDLGLKIGISFLWSIKCLSKCLYPFVSKIILVIRSFFNINFLKIVFDSYHTNNVIYLKTTAIFCGFEPSK